MTCDHEHLKCTNNVLTCQDCGAVLPLGFLTGQNKPPDKLTKKGKKTKAD